ncbi:MAG: hypothetical protein FJX25_17910 [Alphaproteobacteria bacterium]|nr:hypothetical protein [Alphaproteobacteria bacterium]
MAVRSMTEHDIALYPSRVEGQPDLRPALPAAATGEVQVAEPDLSTAAPMAAMSVGHIEAHYTACAE